MINKLCERFMTPNDKFSPIPFWFWNDELNETELLRQIADFDAKGVKGFVIHPRFGFSVEGGYLGERYFELVKVCTAEAKKRNMQVLLYDEGMYPSGSAHGKVVERDFRFASRALCGYIAGEHALADGEEIVTKMAVKFDNDGKLADVIVDTEEAPNGYILYDFVLGFTGGTIRGLMPGDSPKSADLLNPNATAVFIEETHEQYWKHCSEYFGDTIIGMFTDEPKIQGRCGLEKGIIEDGKVIKTNLLVWTYGFREFFEAAGGDMKMIAYMLFANDDEQLSKLAVKIHKNVCQKRLQEAFYSPMQLWCREHNIALTGHPGGSHDIELEESLDIPGQDIVWRYYHPDNILTADASVVAKCSADMARHRGIERNLCEALGVCGAAGNPWDFRATEMMWYFNSLMVRGVNMISPHAFYYSLRTSVQWGERPPDVGLQNIWWDHYGTVSAYVKRLSWLNSNNYNNPCAAVLCENARMPILAVKPLYEMGYTFNYITINQLMRSSVSDGKIYVGDYVYDTVLVDSRLDIPQNVLDRVEEFASNGGKCFIGEDFGDYIKQNIKQTSRYDAQNVNVRFSHLTKDGCEIFILANEGKAWEKGNVVTDKIGVCRKLDLFTGEATAVYGEKCEDGIKYPVEIDPWSVTVLAVDTAKPMEIGKNAEEEIVEVISISDKGNTLNYQKEVDLRCRICFDEIRDRVDVTVNGKDAGAILFYPHRLEITDILADGENLIEFTVTESIANKYGSPVPSGVTNPRIELYKLK